jgi:Arylsulfotransferase (ASST)/Secretion system C-terminal sorting domain/Bacterial Ig-like domain
MKFNTIKNLAYNYHIRFVASIVAFIWAFFSLNVYAQADISESKYQYLYPVPNSILVSPKTNIIIRYGENINSRTVSVSLISVIGSISGPHNGNFLLSDDNQTMVFNPSSPFVYNETVYVMLKNGIKTSSNIFLPECIFNFKIVQGEVPQDNSTDFNNYDKTIIPQTSFSTSNYLPQPTITVDSVNNPSPGYIFLATWDRNSPNHLYANYIFILDSAGSIVDSIRINGAPFDFKIQPNGYLSYAKGNYSGIVPGAGEDLWHYVLDSTIAVVDSFQMKNGYETDFHEFLYLPNGHAMMMSYHKIPYDMSKIILGGQPNATLVIDVIQEQDRDKNVIFEWRCLDYIPITNSTNSSDSSDVDLTQQQVHYATLNGFDLDNDGNILASFREFSEIMKISRTTGQILWRMGGKSTEFTFYNEHPENYPFYYSRQHNVERLPNGDISIFDNGDLYKNSRAAEYSVDEINKTATLVSEFHYPASLGRIASALAGNAEKLPNGGWFVSYGMLYPAPIGQLQHNIVESHSDSSLALVITLPPNILAYRAYKLPWKELIQRPFDFFDNLAEGNNYPDNNHPKNTGIIIHYDSLNNEQYMGATLERIPYGPVNPVFNGKAPIVYPVSVLYKNFAGIQSQKAIFNVDLTKYPEIKHPASTSFYMRDSVNHTFALLLTSYDNVNNKLIATVRNFGEIIFGEPDVTPTANIPLPFEPARSDTVNVTSNDSLYVKWTGQGLYDSFRVQVSKDSLFNTVLIDSTLKSSLMAIHNLEDTIYYWHVSAIVNSVSGTWTDAWSFKIDTTSTTVGIEESKNSLPQNYFLSQNYPNPFNPSTIINYEIPKSSLVKLKVYDILGRELVVLVNEVKPAGRYKIIFNASNYSSGVYFYKIEAGNFSKINKMVLLK